MNGDAVGPDPLDRGRFPIEPWALVETGYLPDDLQPSDDNPLAQPLDPDDEATKDADELGMDDTQADTSGDYTSSGDTPSTELDDELESEDGAGHGDGAQGAGISS